MVRQPCFDGMRAAVSGRRRRRVPRRRRAREHRPPDERRLLGGRVSRAHRRDARVHRSATRFSHGVAASVHPSSGDTPRRRPVVASRGRPRDPARGPHRRHRDAAGDRLSSARLEGVRCRVPVVDLPVQAGRPVRATSITSSWRWSCSARQVRHRHLHAFAHGFVSALTPFPATVGLRVAGCDRRLPRDPGARALEVGGRACHESAGPCALRRRPHLSRLPRDVHHRPWQPGDGGVRPPRVPSSLSTSAGVPRGRGSRSGWQSASSTTGRCSSCCSSLDRRWRRPATPPSWPWRSTWSPARVGGDLRVRCAGSARGAGQHRRPENARGGGLFHVQHGHRLWGLLLVQQRHRPPAGPNPLLRMLYLVIMLLLSRLRGHQPRAAPGPGWQKSRPCW